MDRHMKSEFDYVMSLGDKLGRYVDKWIAVVDNRIVAEGTDAKEVFRKAREASPSKTPFVMKVPSDPITVL